MHRADDERFGISDSPIPGFRQYEVRQYAAFQEPYLGENPRLRFFVRGGRVGVEVIDLPQGVADRDQAPITTRVGQTTLNLVVQDGGWVRENDVIGYGVLRDG
jgi:hypothetical protein